MRNGFSFKGCHSSEFDVTVKTLDRPVEPTAKEQLHEPSDMDGEHDFNGSERRRYYSGRVIKVEMAVTADNLSALQKKLGKIARWIMGEGELIFDDMPNVKWYGRVVDSVSYKPENGGKNTVLSISFKVKPFSELAFDVPDGPLLDSDIELDSDIPLDFDEYFTFNGTGTYTVTNIGNVFTKPIIEVSDCINGITISCNGKTITVKTKEEDFTIDCIRQQVYIETLDGKESLMNKTEGEFFELSPGDNTIIITGDATVEVGYTPQYMYDADLEDLGLKD